MASKVRKGDQVVVIAGAARGTQGVVTRVIPEFDQVVVEGVNRVKRHVKPNARMPEGGIIEKDRPIHASNVAVVDPSTGKPTRVKFQVQDGKKVRVAKSGAVIENAVIEKQTTGNQAEQSQSDAG